MSRRRSGVLVAMAAIAALFAGTPPAFAEVDDERLLGASASADAWLTYGRDYSQQRYAPLEQIDPSNVAKLRPAWIYQTGIPATFQSTPLVADGVMYLSAPGGDVIALDASRGVERWRYRHPEPNRPLCCGKTNRGVALGYGKVFVATPDAVVVALDERDGRVLWTRELAGRSAEQEAEIAALPENDPRRRGVGAAMAPLVAAGKVFVGVTGVGYGAYVNDDVMAGMLGIRGLLGGRGYLVALDAEDGEEQWRWHSIPEEGWEGVYAETTPGGSDLHRNVAAERKRAAVYQDAWRGGGGSVWNTPTYDPELGLLYVGVGNPTPHLDGFSRPGDNLYSMSIVALDIASGSVRWHFQQVPHDRWGYDVASPPFLFEWVVGRERRKALGQASKTGWLYIIDRENGELIVRSDPFVPQQNLFALPTQKGVTIAPGAVGGASWSPVSFDPTRRTAFVAAVHMPMHYQLRSSTGDPTREYIHAELVPGGERYGTLTAIDVETGSHRWQVRTADPLFGGTLATASGLVFTGEGRGVLAAFGSESGERLWEFRCGAGVNAPPMSYAVDGQQYVAVAAGGHQLFDFPLGDALVAFALPD